MEQGEENAVTYLEEFIRALESSKKQIKKDFLRNLQKIYSTGKNCTGWLVGPGWIFCSQFCGVWVGTNPSVCPGSSKTCALLKHTAASWFGAFMVLKKTERNYLQSRNKIQLACSNYVGLTLLLCPSPRYITGSQWKAMTFSRILKNYWSSWTCMVSQRRRHNCGAACHAVELRAPSFAHPHWQAKLLGDVIYSSNYSYLFYLLVGTPSYLFLWWRSALTV